MHAELALRHEPSPPEGAARTGSSCGALTNVGRYIGLTVDAETGSGGRWNAVRLLFGLKPKRAAAPEPALR